MAPPAYKPDYGLTLLAEGTSTTVELDPLIVPRVGRLGEGAYTLLGDVLVDGTWFAATVDLDAPRFEAFLGSIEPEVASLVRERFAAPFENPEVLDFGDPTAVRATGRLGELQENEHEQYVPFVGEGVGPRQVLLAVQGPGAEGGEVRATKRPVRAKAPARTSAPARQKAPAKKRR